MKLRNPRLTRLAARCLVVLFRLLFRTLRVRFHEADPETNPYRGRGPAVVYSVWHDVMIYSIFAGRHARTTALVGKHDDGSLLAECLARLGIDLVRGSSSRQGMEALREMIRVPAERNIVLTPDGPRGPEHRTKPGMTLLAARTGRPIVASGFAAKRSWKMAAGWTRFEIPLPFTKVYFLTGTPLAVPKDATREQLEECETLVQQEMDRLTKEARQLALAG
ncbi:MAG: lysophospholipid acyltransferase family protein [Planctomycetales bacterium]|nr:lysophospholipid acyltransferase family protein [Planctomycetales bacterium]